VGPCDALQTGPATSWLLASFGLESAFINEPSMFGFRAKYRFGS
jgi:hypothetical protein